MTKIICATNALLLFLVLTASGEGPWISHGPFGGDVVHFTFHPRASTLIFAVAGAEYPKDIYRSSNAGTTWKRLAIPSDHYVVKIDPVTPHTVIVAGSAVYSSNDQGATWQPLTPTEYPNQPFKGYSIDDLEFHSTNHSILYAVGNCYAVVKSADGGKTWNKINKGLGKYTCGETAYLETPQLEVDPKNGNVVYLSLSGRIFKSTDGGATWKLSFRGLKSDETNYYPVRSLAIDPLEPGILYAAGSFGVLKTVNAGNTWVSTNCNCEGSHISIDPNKTQNVYVSGPGGLSKSTTGGKTWTAIRLPASLSSHGFFSVGVHPNVRNFVLAGVAGLGIYKSTNGGEGWKRSNTGLDALYISNLAVNSGLPSSLFAPAGNGPVYRSSDQGKHWKPVTDLSLDSLEAIKIHPRNANFIIACANAGLSISTDGGETWISPTISTKTGTSVCAFDPSEPKTIYLGTYGSGVLKTTDLGKTWKVINSGLGKKIISAIAVDLNKGQNLFVGTRSSTFDGPARIYKTVNGGTSWTSVSSGLSGSGILSLEIDPNNPATVYTVVLRYLAFDISGNSAYKSVDGGEHWIQKNRGLAKDFFGGFDISSITIDPTNTQTLFSVGYNSLYISTDGAENWKRFSTSGLGSDSALQTLRINPAEPQLLYVATSRGVFSYLR